MYETDGLLNASLLMWLGDVSYETMFGFARHGLYCSVTGGL